MATARHGVPLTDRSKIAFPAVPHMSEILTEIAYERGLSRAEVLRRLVASFIVEAAPKQVGKLPAADRDRIIRIASLHSV